ncbi:MAG: hypothetical protein QM640_01520 [Niabella sp.]
MQKIESLVEKLNVQIAQKASLDQLLATVQMLQKEITGNMKEVEILGTSGISVIVPHAPALATAFKNESEPDPVKDSKKEYFELVVEDNQDEEDTITELERSIPNYEEIVQLQKEQQQIRKEEAPQAALKFAVSDDLPTLSRQGKYTAKPRQSAAPKASKYLIKDLKKSINAQDRDLFIKELFRGDEAMFDRSIRTINCFGSLSEAEYWIKRELKTLNGWLPDHPATQQFEQLVRRRFA